MCNKWITCYFCDQPTFQKTVFDSAYATFWVFFCFESFGHILQVFIDKKLDIIHLEVSKNNGHRLIIGHKLLSFVKVHS